MSPTLPRPLAPEQLLHRCDPAQFSFETTAELQSLDELIGQMRAHDALRFGAGMRHEGYNIFVLGEPGMGKRTMVRQVLAAHAAQNHRPSDWCYLNNFAEPHKPLALQLPAGRGNALRHEMEQVVEYLRGAIPALFESDEYNAKTKAIHEEFEKRQGEAFRELSDAATEEKIALLRTPHGFAFAPVRNNEVLPPDDYEKLPDEERERIGNAITALQARLELILAQVPQWWKERTERIKQLNRETIQATVDHVMEEPREHFGDQPAVLKYLDEVQQDLVEHADDFRKTEEQTSVGGVTIVTRESFHRYQVNVLVSHEAEAGAPVISEDNPSYTNLLGRVEHIAQLGALVTDFTLIKPGALHKANGGYLLLDVRKVLMQPFAWEGLKRALQSREIRIESLGQMVSLVSTVSLEPEPIPLDAKIILFGERLFYYLLQEYDPEFAELFKVAADFEDEMERTPESQLLYARLLATLAAKYLLLPLDRGAVARVIEHSARLVGDAERLSTQMSSIADLLREADYWARQQGVAIVSAAHVQQAIATQIRRVDRLRDRLHEEILRDTLLIDTSGAVVGQINGLSVLQLGGFAFAQPTRITATCRLGDGEMVNIEREARLSGAIHSKGVMILSSFLASRFAKNQPLALSASLVFEQSYGHIDGDSASLAELCALLSGLANLPIRQGLAITGSVNQLGQAQAIGAVNEKIEGFFDICKARGLDGRQGVLIPAANVKHLMLRQDVVDAVAAGQFAVHTVETVDDAIALLTGVPAGVLTTAGQYPEGSVNERVARRIADLGELRNAALHALPRGRRARGGAPRGGQGH